MPAKNFKPHVGRLFQLKNYTDLKKFPPVVLIMDENNSSVMFLDNTGSATWVKKHYLRNVPIASTVFASSETIEATIALIEKMRSTLAELNHDKIKGLNKLCTSVYQQLRDIDDKLVNLELSTPDQTGFEESTEPCTCVEDNG